MNETKKVFICLISFVFMGKYLDDVHSCVSISNGMRHSNDYGDMDIHGSSPATAWTTLSLLSISHIGR